MLPRSFYPVEGRKEEFDAGWFNKQGGFMQFIEFEQLAIQGYSFELRDGNTSRPKLRITCGEYATDWEGVDIPQIYMPET